MEPYTVCPVLGGWTSTLCLCLLGFGGKAKGNHRGGWV